jgi:DNA-directed RNA polymerase specialized sigma24 family protein
MNDTLEKGDEMIRIERFAGENLEAASEAFTALAPKVRTVVIHLLASLVPRMVEREDIAETVLQRLWQNRTQFEPRSVPAWWGYVAVTSRRCALDYQRPEVPAEIEDRAADSFEESLTLDPARLYEGADELWLHVDPTLPPIERDRRLLAAQLYVLHGQSREEASATVGAEPLMLDHWLRSGSTLLRLGYFYLYWNNDRLACYLLDVDGGAKSLDRLTVQARNRSGTPPMGSSWTKVQIVILRIRNGLTEPKIAQMLRLEIGEVGRVTETCIERFPFSKRAQELKKKLRSRGLETRSLSSMDLWRRLAFQYFAADALPHRHILERTSEPAELLGYGLNAGILNAWLSNRRILAQLASYLQKEIFHA